MEKRKQGEKSHHKQNEAKKPSHEIYATNIS
jgi:hypothetical protein